jgi:HK97 family phage prohead protease
MRFIISDESVNRYGYRILSRGMSTASFEKNPVVFYNHGTYSLPIGKGKNLQHEVDGTITLDIDFDMEDEQAVAVQKKAERGFLNACSVGIDVLETSTDASLVLTGQTRPTVTRSELLELSICGIPGNRNALRLNGVHTEDIEHILPRINHQTELNMKRVFEQLGLPETATEADILAQLAALETDDIPTTNAVLARLDAIDQKITDLSASKKVIEETEKTPRLTDLMKGLRAEAAVSTKKEEMTWAQLQALPEQEFEQYRAEQKEAYSKLFSTHYGFEPTY